MESSLVVDGSAHVRVLSSTVSSPSMSVMSINAISIGATEAPEAQTSQESPPTMLLKFRRHLSISASSTFVMLTLVIVEVLYTIKLSSQTEVLLIFHCLYHSRCEILDVTSIQLNNRLC